MADDKVSDLAGDLAVGGDKWGYEDIEKMLRHRLKPLLDAAEAVVSFHTHKNLNDCLSCRLAAELKHWRKE